jgi:hypothetical protein
VLGRLGESLVEVSQLSIPADQPGNFHLPLIFPLAHI